MLQQQQFQPKELLFREGDIGAAAFIIRSGQVEILKHAEHGEIQLAVLEQNDVLGEMALFEANSRRSATARALTPVAVDVISSEMFSQAIGQIPPAVQKMVWAISNRLRETNQRLAAKERASVVLDAKIDRITISPATDAMTFQPFYILSANLPFTIGGYPKNEPNPHTNNLDLPCDGPPLMVSQKHLLLETKDGEVFAVDTGSRFCSIVNGKVIGRGKLDSRAQLQLGENKITLGDYRSPYKLLLNCE